MSTDQWLNPDRLLPADERSRAVARGLYELVADAPILSPHGHVDPRVLLEDQPFPDPASLLVSTDHYITRLIHASGVPLGSLIGAEAEPREVWRAFSARWDWFSGTASGYWMRDTLGSLFGATESPSAENADRLFDDIQRVLERPEFRPRALFDSFGIEVLATTDDPLDDLAAHAALRDDPSFRGRVTPTFRPDAYINPAGVDWRERVERLAAWAGDATPNYRGYIDALEARRAHFVAHGAVSADHGVAHAVTADLSESDAAALFDRSLAGTATPAERALFLAHMLTESARMSVNDGLVMTIHSGVFRNHSTPTFDRFGGDSGHDIPVATSFTENLRPLLQRYGLSDGFHLVLFALDESVWAREVAPLAGFYPSVFIGAPWWFFDAPDAILRFRAATTETAGFYRGSGFIDDTRAFLSIPARHDTARRLDATFLAGLVAQGRVSVPEAERIARDLVDAIPRRAFKL